MASIRKAGGAAVASGTAENTGSAVWRKSPKTHGGCVFGFIGFV